MGGGIGGIISNSNKLSNAIKVCLLTLIDLWILVGTTVGHSVI